MDYIKQDALLFFGNHPAAYLLYETFEKELLVRFPETNIRVQKSQITFSNRHVYACVSLQRVKKRADLPEPYIVITLGLSYPLASERVAVKTEPYPGRWTTHIVIGSIEEVDAELFTWVKQAYDFAAMK